MDTTINVNSLSRQLYKRGTHRLLGNPSFGSLTAFLTALLLIRITANVYLSIDLWRREADIDAVQIASAHFVFFAVWAVWIGALASLRISLALPQPSFIDLAPHGRAFRLRFIRNIVLLRPTNIGFGAVVVLTVIIFSTISGSWNRIVARALLSLLCTFSGVILITAVASKILKIRSDIQILEILYLLFLVVQNPDVASVKGRVCILFGGAYYSFSAFGQMVLGIGLAVVVALFVLLLVKMLSVVSNLFRRQVRFSPMERWYWRILHFRSWLLLYAIVGPVFISSGIAPATKRWTLALSIIFGIASYLYFIAQCESALNEKWRCSLFENGNIRLIARSVPTHIVLMAVPVMGYVLFC